MHYDATFTIKNGRLIFVEKGNQKSTTGNAPVAIVAFTDRIADGGVKATVLNRAKFKTLSLII